MAFVQRFIQLTVQLAPNTGTNQPNTFTNTGSGTLVLDNSRTIVRVENSGSAVNNKATVKIYGLTPNIMNQLSTLGLVFDQVPKNALTIAVSTDSGGWSSIFSGTIWHAYADYSSQPDVPFHFEIVQGAAFAALTAAPSSFPGSTDVATIMSGFARLMKLTFENNGVSSKLSNTYYSGDLRKQAQTCADDAGITLAYPEGKLAIFPKGGNRNTPSIPTISPANGLVSYPAFTQQGIILKTVFNPLISFGSLIKIESSILSGIAAAKNAAMPNSSPFPTTWAVNKLDFALDSMMPKGEWLSTIYAYNPQFARGIIAPGSG